MSESVEFRFLAADDADRFARMFGRSSPHTIRLRFFTNFPRLEGWLLSRLVDIDHDGHEALVALCDDELVAEARFVRSASDPAEAEVAVMVEDSWQGRGIGRELMTELARVARRRGIERFTATMLTENDAARGLARRLAPGARFCFEGRETTMVVPLARAA